ncbi:outer membrane protein [Mesorhizobium metallidurans]|nr:outer membrane beta-barrel protein [Mesorhizobium metallidurans]
MALTLGWNSANAADAAIEVPAAQDLWYVTLFGGASFPNDVKTFGVPYNQDFSMDFDTGFVVGGVVGRRLNDVFRLEGELSYARYKADSYVEGPSAWLPADGDLSATYLLANVWADVAHFGDAKLYVGGGIGAAYVTADTTWDGHTYGYGSGGWGFAGQAGAGVTYALAQNIDLDFGYRFKAVSAVDFESSREAVNGVYQNGKLNSHNLQLGVTFKF